ncbi:hypothetical protein ABVC73_06305, partial [Prevotella melaninogenica]
DIILLAKKLHVVTNKISPYNFSSSHLQTHLLNPSQTMKNLFFCLPQPIFLANFATTKPIRNF